ncbi:peptidoglycan-binding protein, partial [Alphaproteobacteria bacterium]|nr:peptidoglycan-binding protein [Alphaproteobacteria bacterium]
GHLSQRFTEDAHFVRPWPMTDRPLLPEEISLLQSRLNAAGYDAGDADGVLGRKTRTAVRKFQHASALVADGYATPGLLTQLGVR